MDNIGENIYAKSANSAKSKSRKSSNQSEKRRTSSISNELSSLANQLNVTNDIVNDEPEAEEAAAPDEATPPEDSNTDETAENPNKSDLVVDDVNCSMTNEHVEDTSSDETGTSEFIHLKKTTTALQSYLEQFQMENIKSTGSSETFDATEELLKMLDKENNES